MSNLAGCKQTCLIHITLIITRPRQRLVQLIPLCRVGCIMMLGITSRSVFVGEAIPFDAIETCNHISGRFLPAVDNYDLNHSTLSEHRIGKALTIKPLLISKGTPKAISGIPELLSLNIANGLGM